MRHILPFIAALVLLAAGGCVPSYSTGKADLDRHWYLTDMSDATPVPAAAEGAKGYRVPRRVTIRQVADRQAADASIDAAMALLKTGGADEIELAVSPAHAAGAVALLEDVRQAMATMGDMLDTADRPDRNQWASAMAKALVGAKNVAARLMGEPNAPAPAVEPILHMVSGYLDDGAGGGLLADLTPDERRRMQSILAELIVQVGFDVAGKAATAPTRREVARLLDADLPAREIEARLAEALAARLAGAPPARDQARHKTVQGILRWGPKFIDLCQTFLGQWDRMDHITLQRLDRDGRSAVSAVVRTQPGRELLISDVMTGVPTVAIHGTTRIVAQPDATGAGEAVVSLAPGEGGGAIELRYEGALLAAVRALVIPLASGPLREIRVSAAMPAEGPQLLNVTVLSEASDDSEDPRRMLVVHRTGVNRLMREAFEVRTVGQQSRTVVSYITPDKRYTYEKTEDDSLPSQP